jgi:hypothetical protein
MVACLALLVSPAFGAPGGNGGGKGRGGGGGSQDVAAESSIDLEAYSDLRLGGYVGFTTVAADIRPAREQNAAFGALRQTA